MDKGKWQFISKRAAQTWSNTFIKVNKETIDFYTSYGYKGFRPGTVLKSMSGQYWYINDDHRQLIATPDFFDVLNFDKGILISNKELEIHKEGASIDVI